MTFFQYHENAGNLPYLYVKMPEAQYDAAQISKGVA
jgi:hypothetical protein